MKCFHMPDHLSRKVTIGWNQDTLTVGETNAFSGQESPWDSRSQVHYSSGHAHSTSTHREGNHKEVSSQGLILNFLDRIGAGGNLI